MAISTKDKRFSQCCIDFAFTWWESATTGAGGAGAKEMAGAGSLGVSATEEPRWKYPLLLVQELAQGQESQSMTPFSIEY